MSWNDIKRWLNKIQIPGRPESTHVGLIDLLSSTTTIVDFNLHGCSVDLLGTFLKNIIKNPAIQTLHVNIKFPVKRECIEMLAKALNTRPVRTLHLFGGIRTTLAELGEHILDVLYDMLLPENMPRVLAMKAFRLSTCNPDNYKSLLKTTVLESLDIMLSGPADIEILAMVISQNPNLRRLASNLLQQQTSIAPVTKALCLLDNFQEYLHNKWYGNNEQACLTLLDFLPYMKTLRIFALPARNIPETCTRVLFDYISKNQTLTDLDLRAMSLNETQMFEFSHAIAENTMLARLSISGTCLDFSNIHHITYFIENNQTLEELDLGIYEHAGLYHHDFKRLLIEAIGRNPRLIKLTCRAITDDHFQSSVRNITRRNSSLQSLLLTHLDTTLKSIDTEQDIRSYFSSSCPNPSPISCSSFPNNDNQSSKRLRK